MDLLGSDAISLGLLNMVRADGDANAYLDPMEFPAANLPGGPEFGDVDRDGDGMATREEVRAFLEEDLRLANSRIYLLSEAERSELFGTLDADGDGRLTPAERVAAAAAFAGRDGQADSAAALDRDGDGAVSASELVGRFTLHLGPGRPPDRPPTQDELEMIRGREPGVRNEEGPEWFRRSDRNDDGVVTWPEFVGPRTSFDTLDGDADGSLTPTEADAAGGSGRIEEPRRRGESLDCRPSSPPPTKSPRCRRSPRPSSWTACSRRSVVASRGRRSAGRCSGPPRLAARWPRCWCRSPGGGRTGCRR